MHELIPGWGAPEGSPVCNRRSLSVTNLPAPPVSSAARGVPGLHRGVWRMQGGRRVECRCRPNGHHLPKGEGAILCWYRGRYSPSGPWSVLAIGFFRVRCSAGTCAWRYLLRGLGRRFSPDVSGSMKPTPAAGRRAGGCLTRPVSGPLMELHQWDGHCGQWSCRVRGAGPIGCSSPRLWFRGGVIPTRHSAATSGFRGRTHGEHGLPGGRELQLTFGIGRSLPTNCKATSG
jgi:hypothetical protein